MIFLSNDYTNRAILSLRTGSKIGNALLPIINASNLKIDGWYATSLDSKETMVLPSLEVRDMIAKGIVVNDHDAITPIDDMVRMQAVINAEFSLIGTPIVSESGEKLGIVKDYAVDHKTLYIKKLYIGQSFLKSLLNFTHPQLIIDRSQILDVTPEKIVVKDATEKVQDTKTAPARA